MISFYSVCKYITLFYSFNLNEPLSWEIAEQSKSLTVILALHLTISPKVYRVFIYTLSPTATKQLVILLLWEQVIYSSLLYRHECFTWKYTIGKIHTNLHLRPEWCIFHILTSVAYERRRISCCSLSSLSAGNASGFAGYACEDIDDVVSRFFRVVCTKLVCLCNKKKITRWLEDIELVRKIKFRKKNSGVMSQIVVLVYWLVRAYDQLVDRRINDVINIFCFFIHVKQIDSMLPCVCSVIIDHRSHQHVVRTSVTRSAIASSATFFVLAWFWHHLWSNTEQTHHNMESTS